MIWLLFQLKYEAVDRCKTVGQMADHWRQSSDRCGLLDVMAYDDYNFCLEAMALLDALARVITLEVIRKDLASQ